MGNASFGNRREELPPGDYLAQIADVGLEEFEDPKTGKARATFAWSVDVKVNGSWESRKLFTGRSFSANVGRDGKPTPPQFVSTLNKLVRACGKPVPQSEAEAEAWNENDLIGAQFCWRMDEDEETGTVVRKFVAIRPKAAPEPEPAAAAAPSEPYEDPFKDS